MATSPGRLAGALTTAAIFLGVLAQPAAAKVSFDGINGARLNMSKAELTDALGQPSSTQPGRNPASEILRYRRRKLDVTLHREQSRVVSIGTTSRAQRTSSGLGVGVSAALVRAKLRGEKCGTARTTTVCSVQRGNRVMDFEIRRGKVIRVTVTDLE
jgi:hypothetical protein